MQKQSLVGVIAVAALIIIELVGAKTNIIAENIRAYLETLICISIFMVFMFSTGLCYKLKKKNKILTLPKPLQFYKPKTSLV